jgi:formate/nitrite transporter FocA (FNT family)
MAGIDGSRLAVIVLVTYLIALGNFDHVVAGTVEAAYLVLEGAQSFGDALTRFFLPTLLGNVIGGTVIFTLLSYAQIHDELKETTDDDGND